VNPLFSCTPTKLATFADCPRKYRMVYVDRPRPARGPAWAHTSFGISVHNALAQWWGQPDPTPASAGSLLHAGWIGDGYRDANQSAAMRERAAAMLIRWTHLLNPAQPPRAVERQVAARTDTLALSGRVDRIDERDGQLVIVDYKTGRHAPTDDDARSSQALAIYAHAAGRMFRQPCTRVELHHLPSGQRAVAEHTDESLARHIRRAESLAADAVAATERHAAGQPADEAFPANPGPLCSWCDYRQHCPEGQAAGRQLEPWAGIRHLLDDEGN
jgi:putative RecB family exonuclease